MSTFIHLHTHSYYSLLDGVASPEELVLAARKLGMKVLALTDHNGLYGAIEFYRAAKEHGIKPIIGAELTLSDGGNLVLLIRDARGYRNLSQIISKGRLEGGHLGFKCSLATISKYRNGLIALSGGRKGRVTQLLRQRKLEDAINWTRQLHTIFGEHLYLELQQHSAQDTLLNLRLRDIAVEQKIPLVATNDIHFTAGRDWQLRRILRAIHHNTVLDKVDDAGSSEQYLKSPAQMEELFSGFSRAVSNTQAIALQCNFEFELGKPVFPSVALPEDESSFSYLWKLCFNGASQRYRPLTQEVLKRLEYELKTIHTLGFAEYFLIVKDIVDYCLNEHIPCVGRGSAADSLVSYVLGITQVDPIRHNLYFERFLNPERRDPPDIDLDLCWKNRDRVLNYVYEKYGQDRTAMICTFNTFQGRSAVRDVARTYGLPEDEIGKITRHLPHHAIDRLEEVMASLPEMREFRGNLPMYEEILRMAQRMADFPRHLSIHPGGVIIAPDRITNYTPLEVAGKGFVISQYDMYSIEQLGLVKMDLLGVRSLSVITDCMKAVTERNSGHDSTDVCHSRVSGNPDPDRHRDDSSGATRPIRHSRVSGNPEPGIHPDDNAGTILQRLPFLLKNAEELSPLDLRTLPEDDPEITAFIRSGQTLGCFQLESPAMRGLLKKMRIDHVDDVITAVALIRPGASGSGMKEVYIRRRAGLEQTEYVHPSLAPALDDTYGVVIYQEQVLRVAHFVAGLSLSQADTLRRAMTKARNKKEFMSVYSDFINGALNNGLNREQAETVWQFLSQFVGYGFNKAHSATYGTIAYQTAFLKYYFPVEYMCAVLNNQGGFYGRMAYTEEARRLGIGLLPPDVQFSKRTFSCEGNAIRTGLSPVFDLTEKSIERIITQRSERPFTDLYDFLRRSRVGEKEALNLIKAGALLSLNPSEPQLLMMTRLFFRNQKKTNVAEFVAGSTSLPPFNRYHKILNQLEILDFAVTNHPLVLFDDIIDWTSMIPSNQLERYTGKAVQLCGWLVTSRRVKTSNGQYMKFLTLEDRYGLFETVLFSRSYQQYGHLVQTHGPYIIRGRVQSRLPGEANLIAESVELVELKKSEMEALLQRKTPATWDGY
jgi:DNA polymerase-3 subunit alpha